MSIPLGKKSAGLLTSTVGSKVDGSYADLGFVKGYYFTTAIVSGATAVPSTADLGDLAITIHATGGGSLFKNIAGFWTAV